jgi:hypothetical protein
MDRDARFARCRACIIVEKRADVRAGLLAPQTYDKRIAHDRAIPRLVCVAKVIDVRSAVPEQAR